MFENAVLIFPFSCLVYALLLKTSPTCRPEAGCREQITAEQGNWNQLPSCLFATEQVLHTNGVSRLLSLTSNAVNTELCSHSPLPFPCAPPSCNPDFILSLGLTVPFIRSEDNSDLCTNISFSSTPSRMGWGFSSFCSAGDDIWGLVTRV